MSGGRRFPASVYGRGDEPDVRFSLANERTYLAWIRTALALFAGGVALELLGGDLSPGLRHAASLVLVVSGVVLPALAWIGWSRTERALRLGQPLPASILGPVLGVLVTLAGVLIVLALVLP
ncbi:YidH family protein [Microbacterium sp. No. 7]|uniref:YidH family protein n=1 Tax=Microbacterium sp. No. 7 TaxID=1714373 RepID=UPI0006D08F07|nr:DUF202 domain-containing protein [Microbacterium sp. No. 7]ALJ21312.1 hypothetical protein AOA12_15950 [Microbacterium sp. No. 7]